MVFATGKNFYVVEFPGGIYHEGKIFQGDSPGGGRLVPMPYKSHI